MSVNAFEIYLKLMKYKVNYHLTFQSEFHTGFKYAHRFMSYAEKLLFFKTQKFSPYC
jgi:hypothetical protein